jgi:hypothetical protein
MGLNIYNIQLQIPLYAWAGDVEHSSRNMQRALDCLTDCNEDYLLTYPQTPHLYDVGLRYQPEPENRVERWQSIPVMFQTLIADCEDIACGLAAYYRVGRGPASLGRPIRARPYYTWRIFQRPYRVLYHIRTELPCLLCGECHRWATFMQRRPWACPGKPGMIEDACIRLGMPSNAPEFAAGAEVLTAKRSNSIYQFGL